MGIYIPNMEMPKECIECEFSCLWVNGSTHCMVDGEELFCDGIPQRHDCPLIEVSDEIWEALKPKVETMSLAEKGWITDDSNTYGEAKELLGMSALRFGVPLDLRFV